MENENQTKQDSGLSSRSLNCSASPKPSTRSEKKMKNDKLYLEHALENNGIIETTNANAKALRRLAKEKLLVPVSDTEYEITFEGIAQSDE